MIFSLLLLLFVSACVTAGITFALVKALNKRAPDQSFRNGLLGGLAIPIIPAVLAVYTLVSDHPTSTGGWITLDFTKEIVAALAVTTIVLGIVSFVTSAIVTDRLDRS